MRFRAFERSRPQPTDPLATTLADARVSAGRQLSVLASLRDRDQAYVSLQSERLLTAFENIREGLAMYDEAECLVMMNSRYAEMYQVPPELQVAGTRFATLIDYWREIRLLVTEDSRRIRDIVNATGEGGRFRIHLFDGRVYELNERCLPGGGWVSTHEDISDRVAAEDRILYLARHDSLTGLFNRGSFQEAVVHRLATGADQGFAVLIFDLDRFKSVNDLHGHPVGDMVLVEIARRIRKVLGPDRIIARLGSDEFAAVIDGSDQQAAWMISAALVAEISTLVEHGDLRLHVGTSIGIACYPDHGTEVDQLMKSADRALYTVKRTGVGSILFYHPELDAEEQLRAELMRSLPAALHSGEIELYFQPIIEAATGRCQTAEALLRWTHPTRGRISPELVIAIAEESRYICQLGDWILHKALETARSWPDDIVVAVNLSASQFRLTDFAGTVINALERSGVSPHRLELELTETVLCMDDVAETIRCLREAGIRFSLDDFGTGYASMSYLLRFPFDRVKIDRSFVSELHLRRDRRVIVEAIAGLALKLGLEVVAEGVETEDECAAVVAAGCAFLQGYLFSPPVPVAEFGQGIATRGAATRRLPP